MTQKLLRIDATTPDEGLCIVGAAFARVDGKWTCTACAPLLEKWLLATGVNQVIGSDPRPFAELVKREGYAYQWLETEFKVWRLVLDDGRTCSMIGEPETLVSIRDVLRTHFIGCRVKSYAPGGSDCFVLLWD